MPSLRVYFQGTNIIAEIDSIRVRAREAMDRANEQVTKAVRERVHELLGKNNDGMLRDHSVTNQPRSVTNSSLPRGALRKSIRVRSQARVIGKSSFRYTQIYHEGSPQLKYISAVLQEGRLKTWTIPEGGRFPTKSGKKALRFYLVGGLFDGFEIITKNPVTHPGIKARPYMKQALQDKIEYADAVYARELSKAVRNLKV